MKSPYSAARLNELHWIERKTVEQIAAAYNSTLEYDDEPEVSTVDVESWLHDAGIAVWSNPDRRRTLSHSDSLRTGWPEGTIVRPCATCKYEWPLIVFAQNGDLCSNCAKIAEPVRGPGRNLRAPAARTISTPSLPPVGFSRCRHCKGVFPDDTMNLDKKKIQYGICKHPCAQEKNRQAYLKNQERIKSKNLAYKRAERASKKEQNQ